MKRTICFCFSIVIVWLFSACVVQNQDMETGNTMDIEFKTGTYFNKDWDDTVGTYNGNIIADKKTAVDVATIIFNSMNKSDAYCQYVAQTVFYDEADGIWIVSFGESSEAIHVGGSCSIAIQEKDGTVIRIWFEE